MEEDVEIDGEAFGPVETILVTGEGTEWGELLVDRYRESNDVTVQSCKPSDRIPKSDLCIADRHTGAINWHSKQVSLPIGESDGVERFADRIIRGVTTESSCLMYHHYHDFLEAAGDLQLYTGSLSDTDRFELEQVAGPEGPANHVYVYVEPTDQTTLHQVETLVFERLPERIGQKSDFGAAAYAAESANTISGDKGKLTVFAKQPTGGMEGVFPDTL